MELDKYVPISVIFAAVLFILKEVIENFRKHRVRKNKRRMLSSLLGREIESNYKAILKGKKLLEFFGKIPKQERPSMKLIHLHTGSRRYVVSSPGYEERSDFIPKFYFQFYNQLISELAELDNSLFLSIYNAYKEIKAYFYHFEKLSTLFAGELDSYHFNSMQSVSRILNQNIERHLSIIEKGYSSLTGKRLIEHIKSSNLH